MIGFLLDAVVPFIVSSSMLSPLRRILAPCFVLCALAVPAAAETSDGPARLVADLAPESASVPLNGWSLAPVGNRAVFLRMDNEYAPALWVTDGTPEGTSELAVLCPPCGGAILLGSTGGVAFYRISESGPSPRMQIWRTDGTKAGTFPVISGVTNLISPSLDGGRLFFTACTPGQGCELWSSDGTVAGTRLTGEIAPGPANANVRQVSAAGDRAFVIVGTSALWVADASGVRPLRELEKIRYLLAGSDGRAYFVAEEGGAQEGGLEVWTSDGTAAGTRPVTSFKLQSPFSRNPFAALAEDRFYFSARSGKGNELWSVGPTPQSLRRLTDFNDPFAYFSSVRKTGSRTLFVAQIQDRQQFTPPRLWASRGDFRTTARLSSADVEGSLAPLGQGRFAFHSNNPKDSLWVTDGTVPGTRLLQPSGRWHDLSQSMPLGDRVLFELTNEYETGDLWLTDGTAAGTFFVAQGGPKWSHYWGWGGSLIAARASGRLLFDALPDPENDPVSTLLSSDGSPGGMRELARFQVGRSSYPQQLLPLRDRLLVQICAGTTLEMHAVRGTETELLASQPYESSCGGPTLSYRYAALDDRAAFLTFSPTEGSELLATDGTRAGTRVLIPASRPDEPMDVVRFGDRFAIWVFVPTGTAEYGSQLWVSDGTPEGTARLLDLPAGMEMYRLTGIGNKLYFYDVTQEGANLWMQAWVTDGTAAGTRQLTSVKASTPDLVFTEAAGRVWFRLTPQGGKTEIWSTDGTPAGTRPAVSAGGASGMLDPQLLSGAGGRLYFAARRADDPKGPLRPWVSDGTDAGTAMLADVALEEGENTYYFLPGEQPGFTEAGGRVYFGASDPAHGDELWSTDGTPEGTALVKDIAPGLLGSFPRSLTVWNGRLWFRARDLGGMAHGMELWSTDGTADGTQLVQDLSPGPSWSLPQELTVAGGSLYFSAHDGEHGRELWEVP
ncbi:MAG: ELWxxDGT repeat protein [Acidobacteriota bacterium]